MYRKLGWLVPCLAMGGCLADLEISAETRILCESNETCPKGWRCDVPNGRCVREDSPDPRCGDAVVDGSEECDCGEDDQLAPEGCGGANSDTAPNRCRTDCSLPSCGDGTVDAQEECDDGNNAPGDACSATCLREICGNSVSDPGEACDDGNTDSGDGCSGDCFSDESCGNGYADIMAGESCDCGLDPEPLPVGCVAYNADTPDSLCRLDCTFRRCGDGVVDTGEECDCGDGSGGLPNGCAGPNDDFNPDSCRASCLQAFCGDAVVDAGEVCDDGNSIAGDGCNPDCQTPCGNGLVEAPLELCDGGPPPGKTCFDFGFDQGVLTCSPQCTPDFSSCGVIGWRQVISGTQENLRDVWALDENTAWAVGEDTTVVGYLGGQWQEVVSPSDRTVLSVWGTSAQDVWIGAETDRIYRFNGGSWSQQTISGSSGNDIQAIWGSSPNDVWFGGGPNSSPTSGVIVHSDGSAGPLTTEYFASGRIFEIWGSGPNDIWATDELFQLHHYDGSWALDSAATSVSSASQTIGICGTSASNVWSVGVGGGIIHNAGSGWSAYDPSPDPLPTSEVLIDCWASAANDVWAVGFSGTIIHFDGATWSAVPSDTGVDLWAVWGIGPHEVWAAGDEGVILRYNGSTFSTVTQTGLPADNSIGGIWGHAADDIWAVGQSGVAAEAWRYDGAWQSTTTTGALSFNSVWGASSNEMWATNVTGSLGEIWVTSGVTWTEDTDPGFRFDSLSGTSATDIWAAGKNGASTEAAMYHYDGTWSPSTVPTSAPLNAVWAVSPSEAWAVGNSGTILRYDGAWAEVASPTTTRLNGVWVDPSGDGWTVGNTGTILRLNNGAWELYDSAPNPPPTLRDLNGVWGSGPNHVWIVGDEGTVLHFENGRWGTVRVSTVSDLQAAWGVDGTVWFVGYDSTILRLQHRRAWNCETTESTCEDGIDDDCDGLIDCDDPHCGAAPACD